MNLRKNISAWAGLAALLALSPAFAGTFTISPLRVDFADATGMAVLTVRNEDATPVVVQTQGLAWSQEAGQDALTPSRDILISPAVFTLQPGGSQLVRVALRRNVDPARELTYRHGRYRESAILHQGHFLQDLVSLDQFEADRLRECL